MATTPLSTGGSGSTFFGKVHQAADVAVKLNGIVQAARIAGPYVMAGARVAASLL